MAQEIGVKGFGLAIALEKWTGYTGNDSNQPQNYQKCSTMGFANGKVECWLSSS